MTVGAFYKSVLAALSETEDAEFDALCLFKDLAELDRAHIALNLDREIDECTTEKINSAVKKRLDGVPLQYILGSWEFMRYEFSVGKGVLIPRPETELLVEKAVEFIKNNGCRVVYDLCAGSGAIGLSVAKICPLCKVYLIEKYDGALKYLRKNLSSFAVGNAEIIERDIFDGVPENIEPPDLVLSNPPYVKSDEISSLQKEVLFEPSNALDGGEDGLRFYRCIAEKWTPRENGGKNGVIVECGDGQSSEIIQLFADKSTKNKVFYDFNNIDRVIQFNV